MQTHTRPDIFDEARRKFTIPDLWPMLQLEGQPKTSCRSPFRDDSSPSFSIFDDGKAWCDHGTGEGGDTIEFIKTALQSDYKAVRRWLMERMGVAQPIPAVAKACVKATPKTQRKIQWPSRLESCNRDDWAQLADARGYSHQGIHIMDQCGALRFTDADGHRAFVVTDERMRVAEIRRLDGKDWSNGSKAFPLKGVDKSLLLGSPLIEKHTERVMLIEGATDYLAALDLYTQYRRKHGGSICWVPVALLGAGCRKLHPEDAKRIRGKYVRIVPDADEAGDQMADHWRDLLRSHACTVDIVNLPPKTDLSDHLNTIDPKELFS